MSYATGDKVNLKGMRDAAEIISGPHATHGADRWLIQKADGTVSLVPAAKLSPVDNRRELVARTFHDAVRVARWEVLGEAARERYLQAADAVLAALDAGAPLAAGSRIRILRDGFYSADVRVGDVLTVINADSRGDGVSFHTDAPRANWHGARWAFRHDAEGDGWERA